MVEPPRGRSFIWQIGVNSSIQDRCQVEVFMESSQLYVATLTHYSTEPLTTRPNYDPLLLLLALAGDVHPNPGPSRYPCSVCFKNGHAYIHHRLACQTSRSTYYSGTPRVSAINRRNQASSSRRTTSKWRPFRSSSSRETKHPKLHPSMT